MIYKSSNGRIYIFYPISLFEAKIERGPNYLEVILKVKDTAGASAPSDNCGCGHKSGGQEECRVG